MTSSSTSWTGGFITGGGGAGREGPRPGVLTTGGGLGAPADGIRLVRGTGLQDRGGIAEL